MEDLRQISAKMAMLERQAEALKMNVEMLQTHIRELLIAKETMENIKKADKDQEVLFPIGGGGYTFGKIVDKDRVIINIGSNVAVKEDIEKAIMVLDKRIGDSKNLLNQTSSSFSEITKAMVELEKKGRDLVQQQKNQQKQ